MRIGIIGAGNIGGALTRRLTALGHEVTVANSRGPGKPGGNHGARPAPGRSPRPRRRGRRYRRRDHPDEEHPGPAQGPVRGRAAERGGDRHRQLLPAPARRVDRRHRGRVRPRAAGWPAARPASDQDLQQHLRQAPGGSRQAQRHAGADRVARGGRRPGGQGRRSWHWSTSWASIRSTPAASTNPGVSSRAPRSTLRTSTPTACGGHWPQRARSARQLGARRPTARATSANRHELIRTLRWQWQP